MGFGRIGQMHAQNIDKDKNLKLLYVYEKVDRLGKKAKKIYNCIFEKNYKKIFSDKKVDITLDLPVSRPTSLIFGGPELTKLFITSASHDRTKESMAGHVFVYDSPIQGLAEVPYFYNGI